MGAAAVGALGACAGRRCLALGGARCGWRRSGHSQDSWPDTRQRYGRRSQRQQAPGRESQRAEARRLLGRWAATARRCRTRRSGTPGTATSVPAPGELEPLLVDLGTGERGEVATRSAARTSCRGRLANGTLRAGGARLAGAGEGHGEGRVLAELDGGGRRLG
ncbi:hypothetical protein ZWY2020_051640 [Hordeum vulgare]|nr:hypothetical protein ZWY2020_051640 [Hordeum vulgare]